MVKNRKTWKRSRSRSKKLPKGKLIIGVCLVAAIFAAFGVWQFASGQQSSSNNGNSSPKSLAPDFSLRDIGGTSFSLSQFNGKVILLHFMALAGCTGELDNINYVRLPQLSAVYNKYSSNQVVIVTVSVATCASCDTILAQLRKDYSISWILGNDYDDGMLDIVQSYSGYSIGDGSIVLVDKSFRVAQVYNGGTAMITDTLTSSIDQLL